MTLQDRPHDACHHDELVDVWRALVQAECTEYFEFQLEKHGMERSWSCDLGWLPKHLVDDLSLGRWKYLIWSAVRQGAMDSFATGPSSAQTRNSVVAMLTNPHRLGYARRGGFEGFLPNSPHPHSLMAQVFLRSAARLGMDYWTKPPSPVWLTRNSASG